MKSLLSQKTRTGGFTKYEIFYLDKFNGKCRVFAANTYPLCPLYTLKEAKKALKFVQKKNPKTKFQVFKFETKIIDTTKLIIIP